MFLGGGGHYKVLFKPLEARAGLYTFALSIILLSVIDRE